MGEKMIKLVVEADGEKKQDECGVIAVQAPPGESVANDLFHGLLSLQHRGQESAGIATHDGERMHVSKGMGLASEVFEQEDLMRIPGSIGIGHVRYSTTGSSVLENAQPLLVETRVGKFAIGLNGNIVNYRSLREELEEKGHAFRTTTDTECLGYLLEEELLRGSDCMQACASMMKLLDGAYCFTLLTEKSSVIVLRDERGFRPLCMGERNGTRMIASETAVLDALGARFVRYVTPGEAIVLSREGGLESRVLAQSTRKAHCMFEWVYIARPESIVEERSVIKVRERLGRKLAELYPELKNKIDIVVPIPDSGRSAAFGYSYATGLPIAEALQKNRYVHRTFIMPGSERRKAMVKLKLNVIPSLVSGKRVGLVDDSIVRGTTMQRIVQIVREAGAREVHLLVSCPPIIAPCFMGVDFPTYEELAATGRSIEEIRRKLGVDSLNYMSVEGLVQCIGLPKEKLCLACLNEEYHVRTKISIKQAVRAIEWF